MEPQETENLLRKIQDLESAHVCLEGEISRLLLSETLESENAALATANKRPENYYASWKRVAPLFRHSQLKLDCRGAEYQLSAGFYLNVLQAIHIMNTDDHLIYWNRPAEKLYGYSAAEALGKSIFELLVDFEHFHLGSNIVNRVKIGECWTGLFPVKSKMGRRFSIIVTDSPLYDEDGTVVGVICVAADSKSFEDMRFTLPYAWNSETNVNSRRTRTSVSTKPGLDPDQPLQDTITSKITDLATKVGNKVRSKMRYGKNIEECDVSGSDYGSPNSTFFRNIDDLRSNVPSIRENATSFFGKISKTGDLASKLIKDFREESEGRASLHKITSKAEAWISKKSINWPWRGNQQEFSEAKSPQSSDILGFDTKSEFMAKEFSHLVTEDPGTSLSSLVNLSSISNVSCISTNTTSISAMKLDMGTDCFDYEIYSEDLRFKEQIGQGSFGTVYHGFWCASDVAIKVFPEVEYTEKTILSFRRGIYHEGASASKYFAVYGCSVITSASVHHY